jgi:hypothetical protein
MNLEKYGPRAPIIGGSEGIGTTPTYVPRPTRAFVVDFEKAGSICQYKRTREGYRGGYDGRQTACNGGTPRTSID